MKPAVRSLNINVGRSPTFPNSYIQVVLVSFISSSFVVSFSSRVVLESWWLVGLKCFNMSVVFYTLLRMLFIVV